MPIATLGRTISGIDATMNGCFAVASFPSPPWTPRVTSMSYHQTTGSIYCAKLLPLTAYIPISLIFASHSGSSNMPPWYEAGNVGIWQGKVTAVLTGSPPSGFFAIGTVASVHEWLSLLLLISARRSVVRVSFTHTSSSSSVPFVKLPLTTSHSPGAPPVRESVASIETMPVGLQQMHAHPQPHGSRGYVCTSRTEHGTVPWMSDDGKRDETEKGMRAKGSRLHAMSMEAWT
mmetsp:Transcript_50301/g.130935  ORF Transcript_50301/g.130935 Transcript_50301/m.130935 type:complete len:232 (-) Transcript_50301:860-1555(-)